MRCPKCGYNSFDFLTSCKKCGSDLQQHQKKFGLRSHQLVAPPAAATPAPAAATDPGDEAGWSSQAEEATREDSDFGGASLKIDDEETSPASGFIPAHDPSDEFALDDFSVADWPDSPAPGEEFSAAAPTGSSSHLKGWDVDKDSTGEQSASFGFDASLPETAPALFAKEAPSVPVDDGIEEAAEPAGINLEFFDADDAEEEGGEDELSPLTESGDFFLVDAPPLMPLEAEPNEEIDDDGETTTPEAAGETAGHDAHWFLAGMAATPFSRFGASLVDLSLLLLVFCVFLLAGNVFLLLQNGQGLSFSPSALVELATPCFLLFFTLCFGYFTLFHFLAGQTPGKMLFGLCVVADDGAPLTLGGAFLRSAGGLLSLLPAGLGFLSALLAKDGRSWSDRIGGSRVVRIGLLPETDEEPEEA